MPKINTKLFVGESIICERHPMFSKHQMASAVKFPTLGKCWNILSQKFLFVLPKMCILVRVKKGIKY